MAIFMSKRRILSIACLVTPIYIIFIQILQIKRFQVRVNNDLGDFQSSFRDPKAPFSGGDSNFDSPPETDSDKVIIGCDLPKLKPFHPSVADFTKGVPDSVNCENELFPLLFKADLESNLVVIKPAKDFGLENCCYKELIRGYKSDTRLSFSKTCVAIRENSTDIPEKYEFIGIFCDDVKNGIKSRIIDMLAFTRLKPTVETRIKEFEKRRPKTDDGFNVLILGLDSMSHMNLIRTMPETHKFLKEELGGVEMNGYTSLGSSTYPNIIAVLSGLTEPELEKNCRPEYDSEFDSCPLIWKNFSAQGYRTSYGEDSSFMVTFNYVKKGFLDPPVDYYLRPLMLGQAQHIGSGSAPSLAPICHGPRLAFDILRNHIEELGAILTPGRRKYFQLIWSNSMTHDYLINAKLIDRPLHSTFKSMKEKGHLNNTIIIFFSDHGFRWEEIRATRQGQMEARLPFLYVALPDRFVQKYPQALLNLQRNKDRLTTPFDLYETLKHILHLDKFPRKFSKSFKTQGTKGTSLLDQIPLSRSCKSAGIPNHFCVCNIKSSIAINRMEIQLAGDQFVDFLNDKFKKGNATKKCETLRRDEIIDSYYLYRKSTSAENSSEVLHDGGGTPSEMRILLETIPGHARFEVTFVRNLTSGWVIDDDSRINTYGQQSKCVSSIAELVNYCYCKRKIVRLEKLK